ncbi:kinase non-catalytic C-lobe domain-containing protein 1 isoform X2 [Ornithorhynchus anatinus]|uniref:kinase non-catalytic C-lobe domain-containing protein 1 isoform X2 n=1 Tax=Ornithorhynchus anatinus TaxID=9258 RepID=UPI0010A8BB5A|nr:kinase non-catalytic C-lobe domain-containing protein 1 isoform X2 [Ornithorhynchus anatinus]
MEEAAPSVDHLDEEEAKDLDFYGFEPLPTLLEDEENVSLADILSLRDSGLTEQDIWAICLECSYSMKSISNSSIFQTLCITPDTLAFNTVGNVCFMEQLSDDPEGAFVPPEFDITGNTFEAHIYSLGATLRAAVEYVREPELAPQFTQDLEALLDQMQEDNPGHRPDIESIISLCEEKMKLASSCNICQSLSAVGRRVLSIESFGAFQDVNDSIWRGKMSQKNMGPKLKPNEKTTSDLSSAEDVSLNCLTGVVLKDREGDRKEGGISFENRSPPLKARLETLVKNGEKDDQERFTSFILDSKYYASDPDRDFLKKSRLRKIQTFPKLPIEAPEANNFCVSVASSGSLSKKGQFPISELFPLEKKSCPVEKNGPSGIKAQTKLKSDVRDGLRVEVPLPCEEATVESKGDRKAGSAGNMGKGGAGPNGETLRECGPQNDPIQILEGEDGSAGIPGNELTSLTGTNLDEQLSPLNQIPPPQSSNSWMAQPDSEGNSESEIISNEQRISLQDLLSQVVRPFKEYELWALCHECLSTLQSYTDYPAYLCLDSVLIDADGNVLFDTPKEGGPYNSFYLAPEIEEEKVVTEKASVYCVAAILWTAAKYNFPLNHKLALPRKLKRLLLDMAKSDSDERPSIADAIKTCSGYLLQRGMNGKKVLAHLSSSTCKVYPEEEVISLQNAFSVVEFKNKSNKLFSSDSPSGFVPSTNESKLIAVKGPIPCRFSPYKETSELPDAFTSSATHFKPIIIAQTTETTKENHASTLSQPESPEGEEFDFSNKKGIFVGDIENRASEDQLATLNKKTQDMPSSAPDIKSSTQAVPKEETPGSVPKEDSPSPLISSDSQREKSLSISSDSSACPTLPAPTLINDFLSKQEQKLKEIGQDPREQLSNQQPPPDKKAKSPMSSSVSQGTLGKNLQNRSSKLPSGENADAPDQGEENHGLMVQTRVEKGSDKMMLGSALPSPGCGRPANQNPVRPPNLEISSPQNRMICPSLQRAVRLIQEEFAFDGYLENGLEVLIMGEYIFGLKDLTYATFCGAISEKFCDLYWDEKLLQNLFDVVNGKTSSPLGTSENVGSQWEQTTQNMKKSGSLPTGRKLIKDGIGKERRVTTAHANIALSPSPSFVEMDSSDLSQSNFEVGFRPQQTRPEKELYSLDDICSPTHRGLGPELDQEDAENDGATAMVEADDNRNSPHPCPTEFQSCSPGWGSAFYEVDCFSSEVYNYVKKLGRQKGNEPQNLDAKNLKPLLDRECNQELEQQLMIEKKNYRKTVKFYQKLLQKEKRNKGSEVKTMLSKLKGQLEEMKSKVQFLELVKKYLQVMYPEQWGLEPCALPVIVNIAARCDTDFSPLDESSSLIFYNVNKHQSNKQKRSRILQAGTPLGLMAYLYSRDAFFEGYVQQFIYTFRYFCTPDDFLQFLLDRINSTLSRANKDPSSIFTKIYNRSFCILQAWIEDCYTVDFTRNTGLLDKLEGFISSKIAPLDRYGEQLLSFLEVTTDKKCDGMSRDCTLEDLKEADSDSKSLHTLCKKLSEDNVSRKSFNWKLYKGNGFIMPHHKERQYTIASALPKPCFIEEFYGSYTKTNEKGPYFLTEYSTHQLFSQLTMMQQELFQKCHPVHFLNSRALGVIDKSATIPKAASTESLSGKVGSLFLPNYIQDKYLLQLLRNADNISTWVAAEIVTSHTSKLQVNLLSKFLLIAKSCYEQRNFATAMQILGGLEHLIVRQLPAWKILPAKVAEIMEELKAVEVFLKSDSLCLMEGRRFRSQPTLPSAHLLAMHIQQLETGGFTMTNGAHKWSKLRNIAKVVSQVHAFQESPYTFAVDHKLQSYLKQRIARFSGADVSILAADNHTNFHQGPGEKHSRKIQDTLRRMKATFQ